MCVKLPERIDDGKKPIAGKGNEREHGHADRHVLDELGRRAEQAAPRPRIERVDDGRKRHGRYDQQQVG